MHIKYLNCNPKGDAGPVDAKVCCSIMGAFLSSCAYSQADMSTLQTVDVVLLVWD